MAILGLTNPTIAAVSGSDTPAAASVATKIGIGPFPYDLTAEAVQTVGSIVRNCANLYTVQLDNGIPWEAALDGSTFDSAVMDVWRRHKDSIAPHHQVYVAIAPLAEDRVSWAGGFQGKPAPAWATNETQLTPELKTAYVQYVLRTLEYFNPVYLNVGVEAGDMAAKRPAKWPLFEALFTNTVAAVRAKYPSVKIGISFGLPLLMESGVFDRVGVVLDNSDYVGVSFYPYMSAFYERLGAAPLPAPPDQWRQPLSWLRQRTPKPIAICETGYSSEPVTLSQYNLTLGGSRELQSNYVADLATIASRDRYLFTGFFLSVDYDALMRNISPNDETPKLWGRTGFFDTNLVAKPAWSSYLRAWLGQSIASVKGLNGVRLDSSAQTSSLRVPASTQGFASRADLFTAPASDDVQLEKSADKGTFMRWAYRYKAGRFAWAVKEVPAGTAKGSQGVTLELRSDRAEPLLLQVEESDGEAFYCVVTPGKTWGTLNLAWSEFKPDPGKKRNGVLDKEKIVRIMIADASAVDKKATGERQVDVARFSFRSAAASK